MNQIHPTAVIVGDVRMGQNNQILPFTVLYGPLDLGDDNLIGPHVAIGTPGADTRVPRYDSSECRIQIGSRNIIREFTAIQKPRYRDLTSVGDDVYLMQGANLSHDVVIEDKAVVTASAALAGIVHVLEGANIAMGATISQYCVVGQYAIVAMNAPVIKNIRPFSRYIPGKPHSVNEYAIDKFGFAAYRDEIRAYVLEGARPTSPAIVRIVAHFEAEALASQRETY